jgi:hypothetical protein
MIRTARSSLRARVLRHARKLLRGLTRGRFGSYRPELHYMRGAEPSSIVTWRPAPSTGSTGRAQNRWKASSRIGGDRA